MDTKSEQSNRRNRFLKLSLKKNRLKEELKEEPKKRPDIIVLDESFDRLQSEYGKKTQPQKIYSPIVINDSCDLSGEEPIKEWDNKPSKAGNISLNSTKEEKFVTPLKESKPCSGGWSPAQNIICATPKYDTMPSTPKDVANESLEQCSIKTIQQSQKRILNDLYGEAWKTIPSLFKTLSHKKDNFDCISKKLFNDDDNSSDKENVKIDLQRDKLLYLTGSDAKHKSNTDNSNTEKKCKKKLYTEKIPNTPEVPKTKPKSVNSTTKKLQGLTVTQLVDSMKTDIDVLTKRVGNVNVTPVNDLLKRVSFLGSLADNVPSWRCDPEAIQYRDNYKNLREQLTRRLYVDFNKIVFADELDKDMPIIWDTKLRTTAGTATNRLIKNAKGDRIRTSIIKLSTKVVDNPQRLRDTLIHELCHAATWLIDGELRAGHGPLWKKWTTRALKKIPELEEISCHHDLEIYFKYCYKCTKCGYSVQRHSKSIDVTKKCCGYCRGKFEVIVNKKNKDGVIVSTPARKGGLNEFALYVKENYGTLKNGTRTHGQVMKLLGEQFSARKKKPMEEEDIFDADL
ncbi:uncharacterized protein [Battus philenor]|uniref:uncharacterized protein n=1 Tax=Battus philenor TaxID=42288 RepID=UPI0035CF4D9E